ncbi:MAG: ATP-binding protein [Pseudomonadota bacterium]
MKKFLYDTLLDEENICNLAQERKVVEQAIAQKKKLVIYGPRNFGKTSLIKNVILPKIKSQHKNSFILFTDLMEVKSIDSISQRLARSLEQSFSEAFPAKHFMDGIKKFLTNLRPQITVDPLNGAPSLTITSQIAEKTISSEKIFAAISELAKEKRAVIVLDEFQDIALVEEAQGLFRNIFQEIKNIPIIVMGSKRHLLAEILAKPHAPLAMFGEDLEFRPIDYEEYHAYILERFNYQKLKLELDASIYLQNLANRVPETTNIICAEIMDSNYHKVIGEEEINLAIRNVVEKRQSRFEEYLSQFSENEQLVSTSIAKLKFIKQPNSQSFLQTVKPTSRMVGIIIKNLLNKSVLDRNENGYFIADALLAYYLKYHR